MSIHDGGEGGLRRYDFLIIGAGLYGAVTARELTDRGFSVLVAEKRDHIGGNAFTAITDGIIVHKYGPHIFHTDNEELWRYVNRFAEFRSFINRPAASYRGVLYTLPFNMSTFEQLWGVTDPDEVRLIIRSQAEAAGVADAEALNLEEQAIRMAGTDVYEKLIKGYSEKQWGRSCRELPASIIKRVPVRFDFKDGYYDDRFQGIPEGGYTPIIEKLLKGADIITGADYYDPDVRNELDPLADMVVCSGAIDAYYGCCFGRLEYRSLTFEEEKIEGTEYYQDRAVINYTDPDVPFTRITEHKYFDPASAEAAPGHTVITREFPCAHNGFNEPYYPVRGTEDMKRLDEYRKLAAADRRVHFGGRLGSYRYLDMDDVIASALSDSAMLAKQMEKGGADRR